MSKVLLLIGLLLISATNSLILPTNFVAQPLTITATYNVQPAPEFKLPSTLIPTLSTEGPCRYRAFCG